MWGFSYVVLLVLVVVVLQAVTAMRAVAISTLSDPNACAEWRRLPR
jgi:hypothetical protein